jgi:hypothetical protein
MAFSDHVALLVERASLSIVAVHGGRWSSSGIHWRPGVIVTAEEVLERDDELTVTLSRPSTAPAPRSPSSSRDAWQFTATPKELAAMPCSTCWRLGLI